MRGSVAVLSIFAAVSCFGQHEAPAFEVASIRPSGDGPQAFRPEPGSLTIRNRPIIATIAWAYDIAEYQVVGPDWINGARFDIVAKASTPAEDKELRVMLQGLLQDRFKMAFHRETREVQALVMTVARGGPKIEPTDKVESPSFKTGKMNLTGRGATLSEMTQFLSREIHMPIVDQTGLTGKYNYFLDVNAYVTQEMLKQQGPPPEAASIIAQAMQAQLGLKIDAKKAPVEMLIIERIEKAPTEN